MSQFEAESLRSEKSLEEFISMGMNLRERKDDISWELGDLAAEVTNTFGPKYLKEFSKGIGIPVSTIRRYRDVAKGYSPDARDKYKVLSWSHFRQVASKEDRLAWLERAANEEWSVEKLSEMTRERHEGEQEVVDDGMAVPPKPDLFFCTGCRKWYINPEEECPSAGQCMEVK